VRHGEEATGHRPQATEPVPPAPKPPAPAPEPEPVTPPVEHYDDLEAEEIISLLGSLEASDLEALLEYESGARARDSVTGAIEAVLARRATGSRP
jgi:hypothetical protein